MQSFLGELEEFRGWSSGRGHVAGLVVCWGILPVVLWELMPVLSILFLSLVNGVMVAVSYWKGHED